MKKEVDILGSPSLIVRTVSVDVKQHWARTQTDCRTVRKLKKLKICLCMPVPVHLLSAFPPFSVSPAELCSIICPFFPLAILTPAAIHLLFSISFFSRLSLPCRVVLRYLPPFPLSSIHCQRFVLFISFVSFRCCLLGLWLWGCCFLPSRFNRTCDFVVDVSACIHVITCNTKQKKHAPTVSLI